MQRWKFDPSEALNLYLNRLSASPVKASDGRSLNESSPQLPMKHRKKYYGVVELELVAFCKLIQTWHEFHVIAAQVLFQFSPIDQKRNWFAPT